MGEYMNTSMSIQMRHFDNKFNQINREIPYDKRWENGTGWFTSAVRPNREDSSAMVKLVPGETRRCVSPDNRRLIFLGTRLGSTVVFERYPFGARGIIVCNMSRDLNFLTMLGEGALDEKGLSIILGGDGTKEVHSNFGKRLEDMLNKQFR